ncbi:calcium-translocating P-type ATPase [Lactarius indigo]|nr:calcium-translocating P-type ATPase [Lactarius indigo]
MDSGDLDVPPIALVGERLTPGASSATSPPNSFPPLPVGRTSSHFEVHDFLSLPTPIPRNSRNALDVPTSPTSDPSLHQPPSLTLYAHSSSSNSWVTSPVLRDDNPEQNDGLSSLGLLTPPSQVHRRKISAGTVSSIGSSFTDRDNRLSSLGRSGISDVPNILPSPTNTHVDAGPDTSHPSLAAGFLKRTVQRIRQPSSSPSSETEIGSGTTLDASLNVEPFAFKPLQLANLVDPKSIENLERLGGVEGLLCGLGTNRRCGLSTKLTQPTSRDPENLTAVHSDGEQTTRPKPDNMIATPIVSARAYEATIKDRTTHIWTEYPSPTSNQEPPPLDVLLSIAAVISFALGLFQDFGTHHPQGEPTVGWVEGVAIIAAILVVVTVGSLNDWQQEKQLKTLDEKNEERLVKVIRDGGEQQIDVHQVVVGDVVLLEPGEVIPLRRESSDAIKKLSYEECIALRDKRVMGFGPGGPSGGGGSASASQRKSGPSDLDSLGHADCFIVSGSKVLEGVGSFLVISVGTKSFNGRIMMALRRDGENTPLRVKLNDLSEIIAKIGSIAGGLLFAALLVRYFVQLATNNPQRTSSEKGIAFVNILIIALTLVIVAIPKGLPLTVTHTLAFVTKQDDQREPLGAGARIITLTQNEMTIVSVSVGVHAKFVRRLEGNRVWTGRDARSDPNAKDIGIDLVNLNTALSDPLKDLFNAVIAITSTVFEDVDPESGSPVLIGSKTETALLGFAKELGWPSYKHTCDSATIVHIIPFSSRRKSTGCVVRLADGSHRLYIKGASEVLARKCARHVVVYRDPAANDAPSSSEVETVPIGEMEDDNISHTISFYSSQALLTIALCYRDFPCWPLQGARLLGKDEASSPSLFKYLTTDSVRQVDYDDLMTNLTLICITAIENPLRAGVREAVADCGKAGVHVKMCTEDNVLTARSIAQQCGIYTPGGIVMEGSHFRTLSPGVMKAIVPRLQVLAQSSPEDKRMLVKTLKELGEVVGATGAGTNDEPALKTTHVGFSMGVAGTEVAKEASDIILMDDNFSSIVNGIMWGRCANGSVRKFLQFLIPAHFTTVVIMIVWALASSSNKPILGAVQLLWINVIIGTFATLALTTDSTPPVLLDRNPDKMADPLFTVNMTKQILGQAVYQIIVTLFLHFLGSRILGFRHTDDPTLRNHHYDIVQTLVFNTFVFAQIFNSFNCRRLDRKLNVYEGVSKNWYFMAVITTEVAVQVLICFVGGAAFDVTRIGAREWFISVGLGCVSLPLGAIIRLTPNEPCERGFKKFKLLPESELLPTTRPDAEPGFMFAADHVRANLGTFAGLRSGRMRGSSFVRESRSAFPDPNGPRPLPRSLAMVPSPDTSHSAAPGWQPRTSWSHSDAVGFGRSGSFADLCENGFEVHPGTPRDDPVNGLLGVTQRPVISQ